MINESSDINSKEKETISISLNNMFIKKTFALLNSLFHNDKMQWYLIKIF